MTSCETRTILSPGFREAPTSLGFRDRLGLPPPPASQIIFFKMSRVQNNCPGIDDDLPVLGDGPAEAHRICCPGWGRLHFICSKHLLSFGVFRSHLVISVDQTSHSFLLSKDPTLPLFEGDDLRRLAQEVTKARGLLKQAQALRYACKAAPSPGWAGPQ